MGDCLDKFLKKFGYQKKPPVISELFMEEFGELDRAEEIHARLWNHYKNFPDENKLNYITIREHKDFLKANFPIAIKDVFIKAERKYHKMKKMLSIFLAFGITAGTLFQLGVVGISGYFIVKKYGVKLIEQGEAVKGIIEEYKGKVEDSYNRILGVEKDVGRLDGKLVNIESEVANQADKIGVVETGIKDIKADLSALGIEYKKDVPELNLKQTRLDEELKRLDTKFSEMDKSVKELTRGLSEEERSKEAELKEEFEKSLEKLLKLEYSD